MTGSQAVEPVVNDAGGRMWFVDGLHHREDGPAIEYASGVRVWYRDGVLHRTDGPAIEWEHRGGLWYVRGIRFPLDQPLQRNALINLTPEDREAVLALYTPGDDLNQLAAAVRAAHQVGAS